jgi:hypothetical protein
MIYVVDDKGLNILDQKGTLAYTIAIPGATEVTQDRRLHTYVIGKVFDLTVNATVTCVYHLEGTGQGNYKFIDTLIHPFCDASRQSSQFRGAADVEVTYTGLACLSDNTLYVTRKGPRNQANTFVRPDNAVLIFNQDGLNIGYVLGGKSQNPDYLSQDEKTQALIELKKMSLTDLEILYAIALAGLAHKTATDSNLRRDFRELIRLSDNSLLRLVTGDKHFFYIMQEQILKMISSQLRKVIWLGNSYHIITVDNEREIVAMQTVKFIKNVTNMNDQDKYVDKQAKLKNRPRT